MRGICDRMLALSALVACLFLPSCSTTLPRSLGYADACQIIGDYQTDYSIDSVVALSGDTCIYARNLTLRASGAIVANGYALLVEITGNLTAEPGSKIAAFNYDRVNSDSTVPPPKRPGRPVAKPNYNPGPGTDGSPVGKGRPGGSAWQPGYGKGEDGRPGLSPQPIVVKVNGSAQGKLRIRASGTNGQHGGKGGQGYCGGDGEQGRLGQKYCSAGGDYGGNGGNGGQGDAGGNGGTAGSGGRIEVAVMRNSAQFEVDYDVSPGLPGAPGQPGEGGLPGRQGCGGRKGECLISEVVRRQGFPGRAGLAGLMGDAGALGAWGSFLKIGDFKDSDRQSYAPACKPSDLEPEDKERINKQRYYDFWAFVGKTIFGDVPSKSPRYVDLVAGGRALVYEPHGQERKDPFRALEFSKLVAYAHTPPEAPQPLNDCLGEKCCRLPSGKYSPGIGCLSSDRWRFANNPNGIERYQSRNLWKDLFLDLIHIEVSKSVRLRPEATPEEEVLDANHVYLFLGYARGYKQYAYIDLAEDVFVRLILTIAALHPDIRVAVDSNVSPDHSALLCSKGQVFRQAGPDATYFRDESTGRIRDEHGFSNLFVVSDVHGVSLQATRTGPIDPPRMVMVLPIGNHRSETIFNPVRMIPATFADRWPDRLGFGYGATCRLFSHKPEIATDYAMNCSTSDGTVSLGYLYDNWELIDVPSVWTTIYSMIYLAAVLKAEAVALSERTRHPELKLHCLVTNNPAPKDMPSCKKDSSR